MTAAERAEGADTIDTWARQGLRTLVVACKQLSDERYLQFKQGMEDARQLRSGHAEAERLMYAHRPPERQCRVPRAESREAVPDAHREQRPAHPAAAPG